MKTADAAITLESIGHQFENKCPVLTDINARFDADGTSTAIVAPSGSGKTTLLAIIGCLIKPVYGSVRVDGVSRRRCSSWVLQTTNILSHRSALDNVAISALAHGMSRREAAGVARNALGSVGLEKRAEYAAKLLSGGEVQRVAVARALASDARFILADEPTGQLDRSTSEMVANVIFDAVSDRSLGLILVTHDLDLARRCDRLLTLVDSRLVPM